MSLYSRVIFPRLIDLVMSDQNYAHHRQQLLSPVQGKVLEIGFGTGLNLPYYSAKVKHLVAIDPNPGMNKLAHQRLAQVKFSTDIIEAQAESLPFPSASFDYVVSTWTLCSIPNISQAIQEIYRVLASQGQFLFIEHGLSDDPELQKWQNRLNPLQKIIADGCHLNRQIDKLITTVPLKLLELDKFYEAATPKIFGYLYKGVAVKEN